VYIGGAASGAVRARGCHESGAEIEHTVEAWKRNIHSAICCVTQIKTTEGEASGCLAAIPPLLQILLSVTAEVWGSTLQTGIRLSHSRCKDCHSNIKFFL